MKLLWELRQWQKIQEISSAFLETNINADFLIFNKALSLWEQYRKLAGTTSL